MEVFLFCTPLPPGNSSLASYFASKILTFKTPLPLGISDDLPWGGYGFFWNCTIPLESTPQLPLVEVTPTSTTSWFLHFFQPVQCPGGGGGVLPYMSYTGMCHCEGYGFQRVYSQIGYRNQRILV